MSKKIIILCLLIFSASLILSFFVFISYYNSPSLTNYSFNPPPRRSPSATSEVSLAPPKNTVYFPNLSLDSIFSPNHSWITNLPQDQITTLVTTGDVIPARSVNFKMTQYNDFTHPFLKTAEFLRSADLTLINLESPLTKNCPIINSGMVFCGNQKFIDGLKFAGVDVANLANNHSLNWGVEGLCQTINLLEQNQILSSGFVNDLSCIDVSIHRYEPKQLSIKDIDNKRIGFLGWNFLESYDENGIINTIKQAKSKVDFLIISPHWGAEYQPFPAPETIALAHLMIDNGADLIVGNHPHQIQPIEIYHDKLIIYAHGNFIFDQEWSQQTKQGFVTKITLFKNQVVDLQIFPIFISDYNQPEFLEGKEKDDLLNTLKTNSQTLLNTNKTSSP